MSVTTYLNGRAAVIDTLRRQKTTAERQAQRYALGTLRRAEQRAAAEALGYLELPALVVAEVRHPFDLIEKAQPYQGGNR